MKIHDWVDQLVTKARRLAVAELEMAAAKADLDLHLARRAECAHPTGCCPTSPPVVAASADFCWEAHARRWTVAEWRRASATVLADLRYGKDPDLRRQARIEQTRRRYQIREGT